MKQLISFVIPCYHSAQTITPVVEEIERVVEEDGRYRCEVVLVNDNPPVDPSIVNTAAKIGSFRVSLERASRSAHSML